MGKSVAVLVTVFVVLAAQLPLGLTFASTSPAFLWSSHQDGYELFMRYVVIFILFGYL